MQQRMFQAYLSIRLLRGPCLRSALTLFPSPSPQATLRLTTRRPPVCLSSSRQSPLRPRLRLRGLLLPPSPTAPRSARLNLTHPPTCPGPSYIHLPLERCFLLAITRSPQPSPRVTQIAIALLLPACRSSSIRRQPIRKRRLLPGLLLLPSPTAPRSARLNLTLPPTCPAHSYILRLPEQFLRWARIRSPSLSPLATPPHTPPRPPACRSSSTPV